MTNQYKPSVYNHFFPAENGYFLAYNAFSNSLAMVNPDNMDIINKICADPNADDWNQADFAQLKKRMLNGGFLIDMELDEFEILKAQNRLGRFTGKTLTLTIAPTLACSFRCTYCFENPQPVSMSAEVEKALIDFVEKRMATMQELQVTWFGGEPLLRLDVIERLTDAFSAICAQRKAEYRPAVIITNGYQLNLETAKRLLKVKIQMAQVTIDGIAEVHDKRRKLADKNNRGTFYTIIENLKEVANLLAITLRINIDKENAQRMGEFYEFWQHSGLAEKVPFYFGQVSANTLACMDNASQCFSSQEYSQIMIALLKEAQKKGIANIQYPSLYKSGFCCADNVNGYVISPNGLIFKCWEEISMAEDKAIGSLLTDTVTPSQTMNKAKYLNWDPFTDHECQLCSVIGICGGGCVYNGLHSYEKKNCLFWKYNLSDMLLLKAKQIKTNNQNKGE